MPEKTLKQPSIQTAFIYVTEKCNLKCTYCYFKHKKARDVSLEALDAFFHGLAQGGLVPQQFEISGGEPLLLWHKVKAIVSRIERSFSGKRIGLQTNGLLLSPEKAGFIRDHGLALEIGIDGNEHVTTKWRRGLSASAFSRLVANLRMYIREGVPVGCNMTVHPEDASGLISNFVFLRSIGVQSIDVTPAAFMPWDETARAIFKDRYEELMSCPDNRRMVCRREDTSFILPSAIDLSFHPPGHVLCGDAYLCLPEAQKRKYSLWDPGGRRMRAEAVIFFLKAYDARRRKFRRSLYTHRDYVCSSFQIVNDLAGREYLNAAEIIPLMRFLTKVHISKS